MIQISIICMNLVVLWSNSS